MLELRILHEKEMDIFSQLQDPSRRQQHKYQALDASNFTPTVMKVIATE